MASQKIFKCLSISYIVLTIIITALVPLSYVWNKTFDYDVKFSCNRSENVCTIEKTNFAKSKKLTKIKQTEIIEAQQFDKNKATHSIILNTKNDKNTPLYEIRTKFPMPVEDLNVKTNEINTYLSNNQKGYAFHHYNGFGFKSLLPRAFSIGLVTFASMYLLSILGITTVKKVSKL